MGYKQVPNFKPKKKDEYILRFCLKVFLGLLGTLRAPPKNKKLYISIVRGTWVPLTIEMYNFLFFGGALRVPKSPLKNFLAKSKDILIFCFKLKVRYLFIQKWAMFGGTWVPLTIEMYNFLFFWGALRVPKSP